MIQEGVGFILINQKKSSSRDFFAGIGAAGDVGGSTGHRHVQCPSTHCHAPLRAQLPWLLPPDAAAFALYNKDRDQSQRSDAGMCWGCLWELNIPARGQVSHLQAARSSSCKEMGPQWSHRDRKRGQTWVRSVLVLALHFPCGFWLPGAGQQSSESCTAA